MTDNKDALKAAPTVSPSENKPDQQQDNSGGNKPAETPPEQK